MWRTGDLRKRSLRTVTVTPEHKAASAARDDRSQEHKVDRRPKHARDAAPAQKPNYRVDRLSAPKPPYPGTEDAYAKWQAEGHRVIVQDSLDPMEVLAHALETDMYEAETEIDTLMAPADQKQANEGIVLQEVYPALQCEGRPPRCEAPARDPSPKPAARDRDRDRPSRARGRDRERDKVVTRARDTPRLTGPQDLRPASFLLDLCQDQDDLFAQPTRLLQGLPPCSPQDTPDQSDLVRLRMPTAEVL